MAALRTLAADKLYGRAAVAKVLVHEHRGFQARTAKRYVRSREFLEGVVVGRRDQRLASLCRSPSRLTRHYCSALVWRSC